MDYRLSATAALLNASCLTALSGSARLYLAFLLAGLPPDCLACFAAGLVIYSTYTLDRVFASSEDKINRTDYAHARRDIGVAVTFVAFITGTALFCSRNIWVAPFIPFFIGYLYSKGIRIGNLRLRLKGSLGGKNLVIGLTWGGTIAMVIAGSDVSILSVLVVFLFFFGKLFINSVIYDMKDTLGDMSAGIRTLPVVLGENNTRLVLAGIFIFIHLLVALSMTFGLLSQEIVILTVSSLTTCLILVFYSSALETSVSWLMRNLRISLIDCEAPVTVLIRFAITH
ncbi:UbiA family prenyltransferase [Methanoregula formicica]|uniref:4-hydroxybenzoate polyprenyltransferase-like prenyltransferase n=1 Tax=Methanoregula formicica (strain DSM 22288 / NBRC 105244 / SMSP) TaxID=593750 RepID=L0HA43_METFS|nr:UbiA family prenyltransferase [Methanoregula formicica]AGB01617.1 4-hydroxybenzoate polyprenyltransferase-like prenyltransferase [Methanoregula formicica SMSP]